VTTFADLLDSIKDDMLARYRSPIWGAVLIAIAISHWKIIVYLATESHKSADAISFIEANFTPTSFAHAFFYAAVYVVAFPWIECAIEWTAGHGKRKRNEFQTQEREREIGRRKVIAQQNEKALELELKNFDSQSKISDIELARSYQGILSGENFGRWLADLQHGPVNSSLNNTIVNYLHKIDSTEGKFINPIIESAHFTFANDLSTLLSALNDSRNNSVESKKEEVVKFTRKAQESQKNYRELARELLGV
jgi:hypothetical protein